MVAGQPHAAAGDRGGAAEHVGLLDDEHLGAPVVRERRRGQRRASRPHDDDVDDAVPSLRSVHSAPPIGRRLSPAARRGIGTVES